MEVPSDVFDINKWQQLRRLYDLLDQDSRTKIDTYGNYGFWQPDQSHPREDRLAMVLRRLGIYDWLRCPHLESDEMTDGAEEYDEIMAAHDLMSVR